MGVQACVCEIERWSVRGWDLYGLKPIIITSLADSPESTNAKQRLCCVVLRVLAFLSEGKRRLAPSLPDPLGTRDLTSFTQRHLSVHTSTHIQTFKCLYMPTHSHTFPNKKSFSVGNWDKLFWQGKTSVLREQI